jgi:hypothetical protein
MRLKFSSLLLALALPAMAQVPPPSVDTPFPTAPSTATASSDTPDGPLPSMQFVATIAGDEIYDILKQNSLFQTLDKEKPGSPMTIVVSHTYEHTGGAASLATAIFTIGSLGLLPAVTNRDLVIKYEVVVHGSTLVTYTYSKNLTHVFSIYAKDTTHGLGNDGLAWVRDTARQFSAAFASDPKLNELEGEYRFYFGHKDKVAAP